MGLGQGHQHRAFAAAHIEDGTGRQALGHDPHQAAGMARHGAVTAHVVPAARPDLIVGRAL